MVDVKLEGNVRYEKKKQKLLLGISNPAERSVGEWGRDGDGRSHGEVYSCRVGFYTKKCRVRMRWRYFDYGGRAEEAGRRLLSSAHASKAGGR